MIWLIGVSYWYSTSCKFRGVFIPGAGGDNRTRLQTGCANSFQDCSPVLETNYFLTLSGCPRNGTSVLKGLTSWYSRRLSAADDLSVDLIGTSTSGKGRCVVNEIGGDNRTKIHRTRYQVSSTRWLSLARARTKNPQNNLPKTPKSQNRSFVSTFSKKMRNIIESYIRCQQNKVLYVRKK